jgi:chemotaxis protein methyltransferase CheR
VEDTLRRIEARVQAHAGFHLPEWILAARVRDRMAALGCESADEYAARLTKTELDALAERLRVGETRFFRHMAHVGALERVVAADIRGRKTTNRVRAWSAGCATGEEPYTLAIVLSDALPGWKIDVQATDLSEEALAVARAGVYATVAAAAVPAAQRARAFVPGPREGTVQVAPEIAARVRFERKNLLEADYPQRVDVILCRNVLIYFDASARARTIERLIDSLAPGGYLFLGYAESLREYAQLEALRTPDGVVYRRPLRPSIPPPAPVARPVVAPSPVKRRSTEVTVRLTGVYDDGVTIGDVIARAMEEATQRVQIDLDGVSFLADDVAAVLRRTAATASAAGISFTISATRPGPRRWLARHGFGHE